VIDQGIVELLEVLLILLTRLSELLEDPPLPFEIFPPPVDLLSKLLADIRLLSVELPAVIKEEIIPSSTGLTRIDEEDAEEEVLVEVDPEAITLFTVC
jgi:hypothetical protein